MQIYVEGARQFGIAQAEKYFAELEQTFELLADNPMIARERLEIVPPTRMHPHGSHLIVYAQEDSGGITIIRIRHGREDWERDLRQGLPPTQCWLTTLIVSCYPLAGHRNTHPNLALFGVADSGI